LTAYKLSLSKIDPNENATESSITAGVVGKFVMDVVWRTVLVPLTLENGIVAIIDPPETLRK
jgi:hypothetical protein